MNHHTIHANISADGKCASSATSLRHLAKENEIESLEIMIDGTLFMGGETPSTLLGNGSDFLPASHIFRLIHFEPLENGQCKAVYVRRNKTD